MAGTLTRTNELVCHTSVLHSHDLAAQANFFLRLLASLTRTRRL